MLPGGRIGFLGEKSFDLLESCFGAFQRFFKACLLVLVELGQSLLAHLQPFDGGENKAWPKSGGV